MANDIVFKTKAFGGFNKEEVMDFVNRILAEKSDLEKRIADVNARYAKANAELSDCRVQAEEANALKNELNEAKEKNDLLQEEINNKNCQADDMEVRLQELQNENESLKAQLGIKSDELEKANNLLNDKLTELEEICVRLNNVSEENESLREKVNENTLTDETKAEIEFLRKEVQRLKSECEKKHDLERQVGAAMLDARIHSEELVEDAKEKANEVTKAVYSAIGETAVKIDELSGGIGEIARSFTKSVEEVELRIKALTGDMSKTAQLLISESGVIAEQQEVTEATEESSQEEVNPEIEYDFSSFNSDSDVQINPEDYNIN